LISKENCKKYLEYIKKNKEMIIPYEDIPKAELLPRKLKCEIDRINEDIDDDEECYEESLKNEDNVYDPDSYNAIHKFLDEELHDNLLNFENNYPLILTDLYLEEIDNQEEVLFLASKDLITE